MSQYHHDADPQFVAMHSHYENLSGILMNALFEAASEISPMIIPLDSELQEFCYHLWTEGFKIVPINEPTTAYERTEYHNSPNLPPDPDEPKAEEYRRLAHELRDCQQRRTAFV